MREILFRGKRLYNGEWVTGYLEYFYSKDGTRKLHCFITIWGEIMCEVDPATVGQFTGLLANGKRIFEGDVVSTGKEKRVVRFRNGAFELLRRVSAVAMYDLVGTDVEYEIIGNIYDNPELLEVTPDE